MPVKRTYSQVTPGGGGYRRVVKARRTKFNNGVSSTSSLSKEHKILSASRMVTMRYQERFDINPTTGVPGSYILSANGLYDPNVTGTGHQPRGFDQLMAMYRHYEVKEALVELWLDPQDLTTNSIIALSARSNANPVTSRDDMMEHRTALIKGISGSDGGPAVAYHKIAVKPSDFIGLKNDDQLRGHVNANPGYQVYVHINTLPIPNVDAQTMHFQARITYKVKLSEPKEPVSS